jgi:D-lactate dehydrogenase
VKRGVTRDWVLGLEAVTGTGDVIRVGTQTSKGVVGLDLTRLLVGSEGTLALFGEATLRLWPRPATKRTARICFDTTANALAAVQRVMAAGGTPSALEFMDGLAIDALGRHGYDAGLPAGTGALLMLEADGSAGEVAETFPQLLDAVQGEGLVALDTGAEPEEIAELWRARKSLSRAVKRIAPLKINEDVVVPVTRLPETVAGIEALAADYEVPVVNFGHAGNGNLHVNLMVHPDDAEEVDRARACLRRIFALVLEHGGTLSGEHGVGTEKAPFVADELGQSERALHRAIKADFDPAGILNPGKGF